MDTRVLMISAMILASGAVGAMAEDHMTAQPDQQQMQSHPMDHEDQGEDQEDGQEQGQEETGTTGRGGMMHGGMMKGMMGHPVLGRGMMGMRGGSPVMFRMIFALMDTDGDGTVELPEFQAAHEKIFKAMDTNHDGKLTPEEIEAFMRGGR